MPQTKSGENFLLSFSQPNLYFHATTAYDILRAKGIVDASDGDWLYFDYTPGEYDVRPGNAAVTGRFCVIGSKLNEQALKELFEVE